MAVLQKNVDAVSSALGIISLPSQLQRYKALMADTLVYLEEDMTLVRNAAKCGTWV